MLASNPSTPRDILERLVRRKDAGVRRGVAANPSSPPELLHRLANSSYQWIREAVAGNPSCPEEILWKLAMDPEPKVARSAVMNSKLSPETAAAMVCKRYKRDKGLLPEALLFLDHLPEDAGLWGELWDAVDEKWQAYIRSHPFGKGIGLLKALER